MLNKQSNATIHRMLYCNRISVLPHVVNRVVYRD
jgi:hypothetical protein